MVYGCYSRQGSKRAFQFYLWIFIPLYLQMCISLHFSYLCLYLLPMCSAAAVGDLDKSAASQFYLPAGNFHLRHSLAPVKYIWSTERNTVDQKTEIQLKGWDKSSWYFYKIFHGVQLPANFDVCVTVRLASSSAPRPTFCALPGKYLWHKYRFKK